MVTSTGLRYRHFELISLQEMRHGFTANPHHFDLLLLKVPHAYKRVLSQSGNE